MKKITQKRLKKLLHYNSASGIFTRKIKTSNNLAVGSIAGSVNKKGYINIGLDGNIYYAHRLAWLYENGKFPKDQLDHKNQIKSDNRIDNLREVNNGTNSKNVSLFKNNTSGFSGVSFIKKTQKWRVRIFVDGIEIALGTYKDKEIAISKRIEANIKYGFHKNHGKAKNV